MRRGHTLAELLASLITCLIVAAAITLIVVFSGRAEPDPIQAEGVMPTTVHPISDEFSTGYILVEIWVDDSEMKTPSGVKGVKRAAIVRMKRSEYIELMNQGPITLEAR